MYLQPQLLLQQHRSLPVKTRHQVTCYKSMNNQCLKMIWSTSLYDRWYWWRGSFLFCHIIDARQNVTKIVIRSMQPFSNNRLIFPATMNLLIRSTTELVQNLHSFYLSSVGQTISDWYSSTSNMSSMTIQVNWAFTANIAYTLNCTTAKGTMSMIDSTRKKLQALGQHWKQPTIKMTLIHHNWSLIQYWVLFMSHIKVFKRCTCMCKKSA